VDNRVEKGMGAAPVDAALALDQDAQLMLRVRDGDNDSFRLLLEKHRAPVVRFVYRMVRNQAVSEELGQEVFLRIYRSRASYEPAAKFTTWMFRIASHLALNWLRDGRNERAGQVPVDVREEGAPVREFPDRKPTVEEQMLVEVRMEEIRSAIARLPEKQRAAVLMHKYEEMEYSQIAGALGCSESAVKSLLFRAYETLRSRLAHMTKPESGNIVRGAA
jgi:RNA polymerase sigma-70 factor (ECF subfamily)